MGDVRVPPEGMLTLTWGINLIVFILLVFRLTVHRRIRLYTTAIITSDVLLTLSWIFSIGSIITDAWQYSRSIQGRTHKITPAERLTGKKLSFTCGYLVFTSMWLAKGAFVVYCYHLFPGLSPRMRRHLYFVTGFTASTYIMIILMQSLWCRPLPRSWSGKCNPTGNPIALPIWCILNITTDALILVIPLSVFCTTSSRLWRTQLLPLSIVFFVGGLSIFAAVGRFISLYPKVHHNPNASMVNTYELWALIEIAASQMTVCLPSLRVWVRGWMKRREKGRGDRCRGEGGDVEERGNDEGEREKDEEVESVTELCEEKSVR